jgi:hypothetical protein
MNCDWVYLVYGVMVSQPGSMHVWQTSLAYFTVYLLPVIVNVSCFVVDENVFGFTNHVWSLLATLVMIVCETSPCWPVNQPDLSKAFVTAVQCTPSGLANAQALHLNHTLYKYSTAALAGSLKKQIEHKDFKQLWYDKALF